MENVVCFALLSFLVGCCEATTTPTTTLAPCPDGQYRLGPSCIPCPPNCDGGPCNKVTGHCVRCKAGYDYNLNPKCETTCAAGKYGDQCVGTCSSYCANTCHHVTGNCSPCRPGAKGPKCDTICDGNQYGQDCAQTCGNCADGAQCDHRNGNCPGECQPGYYGSRCYATCSANCVNPQSCVKNSGDCPCVPGYRPGSCTRKCVVGSFGQDCRSECGYCLLEKSSTQVQCDHVTGSCKRCEDNREMPLCRDCKAGYWGPKCGQECGACGGEGRCDPETGVCLENTCKPGWLSSTCGQMCDAGWYGQNCSKPCGRCRDNAPCRHDSGVCETDCQEGYEGVLCQDEQESLVGAVVGGALGAGFIIAAAIIAVAAFLYFMKNRNDKESKTSEGFSTLADIHSVRRANNDGNTTNSIPLVPRQSQHYQNVDPNGTTSTNNHDNPAFNPNYDRVQFGRSSDTEHTYDSHVGLGLPSNQSDPLYENAQAHALASGGGPETAPKALKPPVALKPPKKKPKENEGSKAKPSNVYGNVEFK